jgi:hypothetical protein
MTVLPAVGGPGRALGRAEPGLILRRDLVGALNRAAQKQVTIISAPAGSGKTSRLREDVAMHQQYIADIEASSREAIRDRSSSTTERTYGPRSGPTSTPSPSTQPPRSSRNTPACWAVPSLVYILLRCHSTVRVLRNSCSPISMLVRPSTASRAIGGLTLTQQSTRARPGAECPVGAAGAGHLGKPLESVSRALGVTAADRCLDQLGERPAEDAHVVVLARQLGSGECLGVAAEAVVQTAPPSPSTSA